MRDRLDLWPALPLIILGGDGDPSTGSMGSVHNIVAALERTDRVCQIDLVNVESSEMEISLAAMRQPFPELTDLQLWSNDETVVVPDSFLGGSAPRLEYLTLGGVLYPGLSKLLLSATHLVHLSLGNIPHSGYISPDAMATALSTLTNLSDLWIEFESPRSCPDRATRAIPPLTHILLPFLTFFRFKGVSEYLEDLTAYIDAPKLNIFDMTFFYDIVIDMPQMIRFISRTSKMEALDKAHITLQYLAATVNFSSHASSHADLKVEILCKGLDWQLSSLEQVCTSCLPPLSMLEDLYFYEDPRSQLDWQDNIDNELWVELLRPFSAVKNLYLTEKVVSRVAPALQESVESRTTEVLSTVLPALQNIFVGGLESSEPVKDGIVQFVAARRVAGHPIAVSPWNSYGEDLWGSP